MSFGHHHHSIYQNFLGAATRNAIVVGDARIIVMVIIGIKFSNIGFSGDSAAEMLSIMALIAIDIDIAIAFLFCLYDSFTDW